MPNFTLTDHGTIWLLKPRNDVAREWISDNLRSPATFGRAIAIEARYIEDIVTGIVGAGLTVE